MPQSPDKFTVECPQCGSRYAVAQAAVGKKAHCRCGASFAVARPDEAPSGPPEEEAIPQAVLIPPKPAPAAQAPPMGIITPAPQAFGTAPQAAVRTEPQCRWHPGVPAAAACARCRSFLCAACSSVQPDGSYFCPNCLHAHRAAPQPAHAPQVYPQPQPYPQPQGAWAGIGPRCAQHPGLPVVALCRQCQAPVCGTCDFPFRGGIHLCPQCASQANPPLSEARKRMLVASLVLAGLATLMLVVIFSGLLPSIVGDVAGGMIVVVLAMLFTKVLAVAGFGLAWGNVDGRRGNPPVLWIAAVWSTLMYASIVLVAIGRALMQLLE